MTEFKSPETREYHITLTGRVLGTIPKDKNIYETFVGTKMPYPDQKKIEDELSHVQEVEEKGWTGFFTDEEKGLFLVHYQFKGFLKHAGNVLRETVGVKNLRSKIDDFVFVHPEKIYLGKTKPDGVLERSLRVMTLSGERVCLARSDYVENVSFDVSIELLPHKELTWEIIERILDHGRLMGLGQFRNGGYGRFLTERK